ncbi:MAG: hypothetical protein KGR16_06925 [Verrucomicrobia bacterium]|nr:hypothetical protein [Verrucomicrobiota bacterium]
MLAALFLIYLVCYFLMLRGKSTLAFSLLLINFALCVLFFLLHPTEALNIRL